MCTFSSASPAHALQSFSLPPVCCSSAGILSDGTPLHCKFESIREGDSIACHDPTGCDGPEDETEWCLVSDDIQPVMFAKVHEDLLKLIDRNSTLAQIGKKAYMCV
jgi:hypothetical protein